MRFCRVLCEVRDSARATGLTTAGLMASPLLGAEGNREFLIHLKPEYQADENYIDELIIKLTLDE